MSLYLWIVIGVVALFMGYVRLAPHSVAAVHVLPAALEDQHRADGVIRNVNISVEDLHRQILSEPRTKVLAGSPESGLTTYVTRSALWGFPDYTTVGVTETGSVIHARLRFGRSDTGVNARRVTRWVDAALQSTR